jgi:hypothetical protein
MLADDSSMAPIIQRLIKLLLDKQLMTGDELDLSDFYSEN